MNKIKNQNIKNAKLIKKHQKKTSIMKLNFSPSKKQPILKEQYNQQAIAKVEK